VLVQRADAFVVRHRNAEEMLRRIFTLKLATVREDGEPTRRRAYRSEFSDEEWRLVSDLADHPNRAKHESGSILENTPNLRIERFSAVDLLLRLEKRTVCGVELGYRGRASCGISLPEHIRQVFFH
jgi:hypothetical protein